MAAGSAGNIPVYYAYLNINIGGKGFIFIFSDNNSIGSV
jgi:hypothetical protein